ncbi:hypothetical protein C8F01DRAFT_1093488 [Mycena amicta]|nr:hypothetical protein C8F01DRAFT_1093488 [Mycena amicta]
MDDGITQSYWSVFELVMVRVIDVFQLTAIVLQYGAVSETSCAIGLENDVSEERSWCEYFERLGPRYRLELEVVKSNMEDLTLRDGGLNCLRERTLEQLQELSLHLALCVEMQDVPGETLRRIWAPASRRNAWLAMNGLDETLARFLFVDIPSASATPFRLLSIRATFTTSMGKPSVTGTGRMTLTSPPTSTRTTTAATHPTKHQRHTRKAHELYPHELYDQPIPRPPDAPSSSKPNGQHVNGSSRRRFFQVFPIPWDWENGAESDACSKGSGNESWSGSWSGKRRRRMWTWMWTRMASVDEDEDEDEAGNGNTSEIRHNGGAAGGEDEDEDADAEGGS